MSNQVVRIKGANIAPCMTCPLCNKLLRGATTIIECLHTFCRRCIYAKLTDEELDCCPVCNIDLGCAPLEKLRPDHSMQDLRDHIFCPQRRKKKAPELASPVTLPVRRKERSLSSLVTAPRASTQSVMTGRRSKAAGKKVSAVRSSRFSIDKSVSKEEDSLEEPPESSSSLEMLNKVAQKNRQNSSAAEPSSRRELDKETEIGSKSFEGRVDPWKPLNCLVEVAKWSNKSSKYNSQGSAGTSDAQHDAPDSEKHGRKTKVKERVSTSDVQHENKNNDSHSLESIKPKRLRRNRQNKIPAFGESRVSPQDVVDAAIAECKRTGPIWFSLKASEDQKGDAPLPQISASYMRIKNGNVPVSFIQKYLMMKLDLASEYEIEISCMGQPVLPTMQLNNLVDLWLQTASTSSHKVPATIGSSAKDFVMVLTYARKLPTRY